MTRRYTEQLIVAVVGFLMGAVMAMSIAPGDTLLLVGTGIVFGVSARALFDHSFGGDWYWPFGKPAGRKTLAAKPSTGHRYRTKSGCAAGRHIEDRYVDREHRCDLRQGSAG